VAGVTVTTSATSVFEDRSPLAVRRFRVSDLAIGDFVSVRGTAGRSGDGFSAEVLVRDSPE
jgi:hypothetical protein